MALNSPIMWNLRNLLYHSMDIPFHAVKSVDRSCVQYWRTLPQLWLSSSISVPSSAEDTPQRQCHTSSKHSALPSPSKPLLPVAVYTNQPSWRSIHSCMRSRTSLNVACIVRGLKQNSGRIPLDASESTLKAKVRGIQKDISPLTSKRAARPRKTPKPIDHTVFDVTAYAIAEELHLESLNAHLVEQGLYTIIPLPPDVKNAIHVEAKYRVSDEPREIFFFREGSVVFWNVPEVEKDAVMRYIRPHQSGSYDRYLVLHKYEHVEFAYSKNPTHLASESDEIKFQNPEDMVDDEDEESSHQLEKYAFSNALSLSVKLSIWEASLAGYVASIEGMVQDLKDGRKIRSTEEEVLRKSGELFTLKHLINLSSDLLDTPDFYWDRTKLENLYNQTRGFLNIMKRTRIMNERLNHCLELTALVSEHLKDKHHTRLEWMIIWLIFIEVLFEISHFEIVRETISRYCG